jgi:hypothetical protein
MDSAHHKQLDELARLDRLRLLRTWCLALGFVALASAVLYIGGWGIANPKNWASAHAAFAASGGLRWLIVPLMGTGLLLLVVGCFLSVFITKREG